MKLKNVVLFAIMQASTLILSASIPAKALVIYNPTPVQTLSVDSQTNVLNAGDPVVYSASLDPGIWYKFVTSGIWTPDYGSSPGDTSMDPLADLQANPALLSTYDWLVDAKYITRDNWVTEDDADPQGLLVDFGLYSAALSSPGAANDDFWGAYNSSHIYEYEVLGSGSPVDFYVEDLNNFDNFGSYTVNLYRQADPVASVPAPLPVFGAAAAFGWSRRLRRRLNNKAQVERGDL